MNDFFQLSVGVKSPGQHLVTVLTITLTELNFKLPESENLYISSCFHNEWTLKFTWTIEQFPGQYTKLSKQIRSRYNLFLAPSFVE